MRRFRLTVLSANELICLAKRRNAPLCPDLAPPGSKSRAAPSCRSTVASTRSETSLPALKPPHNIYQFSLRHLFKIIATHAHSDSKQSKPRKDVGSCTQKPVRISGTALIRCRHSVLNRRTVLSLKIQRVEYSVCSLRKFPQIQSVAIFFLFCD